MLITILVFIYLFTYVFIYLFIYLFILGGQISKTDINPTKS